MKKSLALAAVASLFAASHVSAINYYSDVDLIGAYVDSSNPHTGEFNITDNGGDSVLDILALFAGVAGDGYDPITETIVKASVVFTFFEDFTGNALADGFAKEKFTIELGANSFKNGGGFFIPFVPVLSGGEIDIAAQLDLDAEGKLSYTVRSTKGDFILGSAGILAEAAPRAVPDAGSTLALLGLGMLGLTALRRRFCQEAIRR